MTEVDKYKNELITALKSPRVQERVRGHEKAKEIMDAIKKEVDVMSNTEGLHGKKVIEEFIIIWRLSHGDMGEENKVNSWTAWAMGMTSKEPDGKFLELRRAFARVGFPDIDTDFDYARRQEVYDYIIDTYGEDRAANIGTYGALKMRSFIHRAMKAIDPDKLWQNTPQGKKQWMTESREKSNEILSSLPKQYGAMLKVSGDDGEEHVIKTVEDANNYCRNFKYYIDKYPDLLFHSKSLEGLLSVFGVHAAGIVISDCPLDEFAPLRHTKLTKTASDGETIEKIPVLATQYEYADLEAMGLIKFDILALSTLTVIDYCENLIRENYEHLSEFKIKDIPLDDKASFDLYKSGNLVGVFQCEEPGMQKTMEKMEVDSFDDIMAGVALYRPGPMEFIPQYCRRKKNEEPISYFHESIAKLVEPYLKKTYGILVYQEQVMQVCEALAGFSKTEGNFMIKAVGKKKKSLLDMYEKLFIAGCEKNNIKREIAHGYWTKVIIPFADYAFNASHSCCYGFISYQTAYLKAHFPEEFICSHLNVELDRTNYDKIENLEKELKGRNKMGIKLLNRNLNKCGMNYEIVSKKDLSSGVLQSQVRPPIRCKGMSIASAQNIIENAPYEDMRDFAFKTDPKIVDMKSMHSLAVAGFFKSKDSNGKKISAEDHVKQFGGLREDIKRSRRKGVMSRDIFG